MPGDPLAWIDDELRTWDDLGLRRQLVARSGPQDPGEIAIGDQRMVNFGSNDYLGFAAGYFV